MEREIEYEHIGRFLGSVIRAEWIDEPGYDFGVQITYADGRVIKINPSEWLLLQEELPDSRCDVGADVKGDQAGGRDL